MNEKESHTVVFKGDARIEILENSDFLPYGVGTHRITFVIGGNGIEQLYSADIEARIADGPTSDLIEYLLASINTSRVKFLKRFNVVIQ